MLQEGVTVKSLALPLLFGFLVTCVTVTAEGQSQIDGSASTVSEQAAYPAFLTSMPQQEPSLFESAMTQKNVELEQRIQRLEAQLSQSQHQAVPDPGALIEQRLLQQEAGTGGLFGSVEVTFLQPAFSGMNSVFGFTAGRVFDTSYQSGVRYVLGYVNDSGLGVRGRYWSFDNSSPYIEPYAPARFGIDVQAVDGEVTLAQGMRHWDLEVCGGLRYGKLQYSNPELTLYNPGLVTFEGVGPTIGISGRRILGHSGFSLFGNVRGALMIGDIRTGSLLLTVPRGTIQDEVMKTFENQLGVAWNRNLPNHMFLEVRTAWETQYWMSDSLSDDVFGVGSNLAFMGPTLAVELRY
jgi:hypothetical protein